MPSPLHEIDRRCHICNGKLLGGFVSSEGSMWRKSAPVIMCGRCDFSAVSDSYKLHRALGSKSRDRL